MSNKKLIGLTLAAAAAFTFATAPITSALAAADSKDVKCYGVNKCKGKSACSTTQNKCKGKNGCRGKGFKMMSPDQCEKKGGKTEEPTS